jgi:hypothetical protein
MLGSHLGGFVDEPAEPIIYNAWYHANYTPDSLGICTPVTVCAVVRSRAIRNPVPHSGYLSLAQRD